MTHRPVPLAVDTWRDVTEWRSYAEENRGVREKRWLLSPDGTQWLRKRPRPGRRFEPAIEWFALNLARTIGFDAAEPILAEWRDDDATVRGICVRNFVLGTDELISGAQVLAAFDRRYRPEAKQLHSPWRVREALLWLEAKYDFEIVVPFVDLMLFDAWIGNADRHPGNWSILDSASRKYAVSPLYDPAGSLGAELQDGHKLLRPVPARPTHGQREERERWMREYIAKCPSGFGDEVELIRMPAVVDALKTWPEWLARATLWLPAFGNALVAQVPTLLRGIDESWLPAKRKSFIADMLHRRHDWLQERA